MIARGDQLPSLKRAAVQLNTAQQIKLSTKDSRDKDIFFNRLGGGVVYTNSPDEASEDIATNPVTKSKSQRGWSTKNYLLGSIGCTDSWPSGRWHFTANEAYLVYRRFESYTIRQTYLKALMKYCPKLKIKKCIKYNQEGQKDFYYISDGDISARAKLTVAWIQDCISIPKGLAQYDDEPQDDSPYPNKRPGDLNFSQTFQYQGMLRFGKMLRGE